jgi:hypothetical protein
VLAGRAAVGHARLQCSRRGTSNRASPEAAKYASDVSALVGAPREPMANVLMVRRPDVDTQSTVVRAPRASVR